MSKPSKTGRRYGELLECIRAVAREGKPFTAEAVPADRRRVATQLQNLKTRGELLRVAPGRRGRFGHRPAVYIANSEVSGAGATASNDNTKSATRQRSLD